MGLVAAGSVAAAIFLSKNKAKKLNEIRKSELAAQIKYYLEKAASDKNRFHLGDIVSRDAAKAMATAKLDAERNIRLQNNKAPEWSKNGALSDMNDLLAKTNKKLAEEEANRAAAAEAQRQMFLMTQKMIKDTKKKLGR